MPTGATNYVADDAAAITRLGRAAEELALRPLVESPRRKGRVAFQASLLFPLGVHTNAVSQTLSVKRALETERAPQAAVLADQAWPPRPCREGLRTVTAYPRENERC